MRFVIALDVSKGKSTIVIYKSQNTCVFEGEVNHTRTDFEWLHQQINEITATEGRAPRATTRGPRRRRQPPRRS